MSFILSTQTGVGTEFVSVVIPTPTQNMAVARTTNYEFEFEVANPSSSTGYVLSNNTDSNYSFRLNTNNTFAYHRLSESTRIFNIDNPRTDFNHFRVAFYTEAGINYISAWINGNFKQTYTLNMTGGAENFNRIFPFGTSASWSYLRYLKFTDFNNPNNHRCWDARVSSGYDNFLKETTGNGANGILQGVWSAVNAHWMYENADPVISAESRVGSGWAPSVRHFNTLENWRDGITNTQKNFALCRGALLTRQFSFGSSNNFPLGLEIAGAIKYKGNNLVQLAHTNNFGLDIGGSPIRVHHLYLYTDNQYYVPAWIRYNAPTDADVLSFNHCHIKHTNASKLGQPTGGATTTANDGFFNCIVDCDGRNTGYATGYGSKVSLKNNTYINYLVSGFSSTISGNTADRHYENNFCPENTGTDYNAPGFETFSNNASGDTTGNHTGYGKDHFVDFVNGDYRIKASSPLHALGIGSFFEDVEEKFYLKLPADSGQPSLNNFLVQVSGISGVLQKVEFQVAEDAPITGNFRYLYDARRLLDSTTMGTPNSYLLQSNSVNSTGTLDHQINGIGVSPQTMFTGFKTHDILSFTTQSEPSEGVISLFSRFNATESFCDLSIHYIKITDNLGVHTFDMSKSRGELSQFFSDTGSLTLKLFNIKGTMAHWVRYNVPILGDIKFKAFTGGSFKNTVVNVYKNGQWQTATPRI